MSMDWYLIIYGLGAIGMCTFMNFDNRHRSANESAAHIIITSLIWPAYLLLGIGLAVVGLVEWWMDRGQEGDR